MTMCRNTPPQRPAVKEATVKRSGAFEKAREAKNHVNPSTTISAPVRLSGRRRCA